MESSDGGCRNEASRLSQRLYLQRRQFMKLCKQVERSSFFGAVAWLITATSALAQPSLLPPGPPTAPSGRMGPRTEIRTIPYTIVAPGSYYLASTLTPTVAGAAITISA